MASKAGQPEKAENPEELLELAEQTLDRLRVMYEQYFLGMQKQAPGVLHSEVERRARDLQQANLRNTALRYRFATLQQKLGSYNAYWKRTLRQIENGTYFRNLAKIGRNAAASGKEIPEEILQAMPKRMREQVQRDRAAALAQQARRGSKKDKDVGPVPTDAELLDLDSLAAQAEDVLGSGPGAAHYEAPMELPPEDLADVVAMINEPSELRRQMRTMRGPHKIAEDDGELDIDSFFAAVEAEGPAAAKPARAQDRGVNFRSVTRSSAEMPLPPQDGMTLQGVPGAPPRPSQQMAAQAPPRPSQQMAAQAPPRPSQQMAAQPPPRPSQQMAAQAPPRPSQQMAAQAPPRPSQPMAAQAPPQPPQRQTQPLPSVQPPPRQTQPIPSVQPPTTPPPIPGPPRRAPTVPPPIPPAGMRPASQSVRPNPIAPGAAANARLPVPVPAQPPIPRAATPPPVAAQQPPQAPARPSRPPQRAHSDTDPEPPRAAPRPPPQRTMPEADFNALHAQYVKAKQMIGEEAGPGTRAKLEKTIATQTEKIREQYGAKSVDFQVVVKDNQVIIRAKPKP